MNNHKSVGNSGFKTVYEYDDYDRIKSQTYNLSGADKLKTSYEYTINSDGGVNYLTNRISRIVNAVTQEYQYYTYNDKGLIATYYNNHNSDNYRYTYDVAGRLFSDGSCMYTYDELNNITTRSSPNFTNTYYYDETNKTRLTKISENYSMKYFRYDASGNMTTYKGSSENADKNLYWTRGNMLKSGSIKSGKSFTYEYDPNNLRYRKTVNGVTTDYYWNGGVLLGEKTGNNVTQYVYDANGIAGMFYNGTYYYFEKNLFGDVLRVYTNGTTVAEFKYDSWGNLVGSSGSMADNVKFRYRGYYYDDETGFYYLQSRYYDPSLGRFISADQLELLASLSRTLGQLNLYAYCGNNPIMYIDETGMSWSSFWANVGNWFASHWVELTIGTAFILGGAIVTALTCGAGTSAWG